MSINYIILAVCLLIFSVQNTFAADVFSAAKQGNLKLVEKLLQQGIDANGYDESEKTALEYAIEHKHFKTAKVLLNHIESVNVWTTIERRNAAVFKFYRDNAINVVYADSVLKTTYLMNFSKQGMQKQMDFLLKYGAEVNAKNIAGETALMFATEGWFEDEDSGQQRANCILLLLQHKASIDAKNAKGETALLKAGAVHYNAIVIETLLKAKADKNARDNKGMTALMHAVDRYSSPDNAEPDWDAYNAKVLLKYNVDINARDADGRTALMHAARSGFIEAVKLLLAHKADIYLKDNYGNTALYYALAEKRSETAEVLFNADND